VAEDDVVSVAEDSVAEDSVAEDSVAELSDVVTLDSVVSVAELDVEPPSLIHKYPMGLLLIVCN